nr:thiamine pyrophosphate-binding protein [Geodermatophilus sabuli]
MRPAGAAPAVREAPAFEAVAELLAELGADVVFSLLGSGNFLLVQRMVSRHGVAHRWARHEAGVVAMADGWARATGRVGVCTLHQGPGLTNAVTALTEAAKAHTPLLVVVGDSSTTGTNLDNQRIDQEAFVRATGAGVERVLRGASALVQTRRAWVRAATERRPVVLVLPIDVQRETCRTGGGVVLPEPSTTVPHEGALRRAADLLAAAQRPLVLAGRGAFGPGAEDAVLALGDRLGALFATTALGKGLFAGSPWCVGISGGFASPRARELIAQADLVVSVGATLNGWTTQKDQVIGAGVPLITVNDDPAALAGHRTPDLALIGDAGATAAALSALLGPGGDVATGWRTRLDASHVSDPGWDLVYEGSATTIDPREVLVELDALLPSPRTVVTDSGRYVGWVAMHVGVDQPRSFVFTQAFMSLGLGLASGLGAAVGRPGAFPMVVTGDGGLFMNLGELDSLAAQGDPVLVVVMDDGAYGAEVHLFGPRGEPTDLVEFGTRDFAGIARALGGRAAVVRSRADMAGEFADWLRAPAGLFLLDCKVDGRVEETWSAHVFGDH